MVVDEKGAERGYLIGGFNGDGIKQVVQLEVTRRPKLVGEWKILEVKGHHKLESKFGQATLVDGCNVIISGGADL